MRERLLVSEGSLHGVSTEGLDTMKCEFDEDAPLRVSDVCVHPPGVVDPTTSIGQVRPFLDLAIPHMLPLHLCHTHGMFPPVGLLVKFI